MDAGISALARHYGVTEAEITEDLADMHGDVGRASLLEGVTRSLIAALWALNDCGFDDAAVTRWEDS